MPWAAKTQCRHPGCGVLVDRPGLCDVHRHEEQRAYSAARALKADPIESFYHTAKWQRFRLLVLREEPLCRRCVAMDRVTASKVADHIVPVKQGGAIWDRANVQGLCIPCHEQKSNEEGSRGWTR